MTASLAPFADRLPPVDRAPSSLSLASLNIDLTAVARFTPALLQRRCFLPFHWKDGTLQIVVPPRFAQEVADEVAFVAGCPLALFEAADGNLPKLIGAAVSALARGEKMLGPAASESPRIGADLVYLEDLGELGELGSLAPGATGAGPALEGDGIRLGAALGQGLASRQATRPLDRSPASPSTLQPADLLPPVVDLEPSRSHPGPIAPSHPSAPRSAGRPSPREEELIEDPDAPDFDILSMPELEGEWDGPRIQALVIGTHSAETERLAQALRGFGLQVRSALPGDATHLTASPGDPALLAFDLVDPAGDPLGTLRRVRKEESGLGKQAVAVLLAPIELGGWRVEADLQTTYGADLVLGPLWEAPLLRRRLGAAFRQRTGSDVRLRPGPMEAKALDLSRQAATCYLEDRLEEAVTLFQEAIRADPSLESALMGLAMARVKQQRLLEAMLAFERALTVDPRLFTAARNLALLYEKRGFGHKARDTWERALDACPQPEQRREILGRLQALMAREPWGEEAVRR